MNLQTEFAKAKALNEKPEGETTLELMARQAVIVANAPQQFAALEAAMGLIGELVGALERIKRSLDAGKDPVTATGKWLGRVSDLSSEALTLAESLGMKGQ